MTVPIAISWLNQSYRFNLGDMPLCYLLILNMIVLAFIPYMFGVVFVKKLIKSSNSGFFRYFKNRPLFGSIIGIVLATIVLIPSTSLLRFCIISVPEFLLDGREFWIRPHVMPLINSIALGFILFYTMPKLLRLAKEHADRPSEK